MKIKSRREKVAARQANKRSKKKKCAVPSSSLLVVCNDDGSTSRTKRIDSKDKPSKLDIVDLPKENKTNYGLSVLMNSNLDTTTARRKRRLVKKEKSFDRRREKKPLSDLVSQLYPIPKKKPGMESVLQQSIYNGGARKCSKQQSERILNATTIAAFRPNCVAEIQNPNRAKIENSGLQTIFMVAMGDKKCRNIEQRNDTDTSQNMTQTNKSKKLRCVSNTARDAPLDFLAAINVSNKERKVKVKKRTKKQSAKAVEREQQISTERNAVATPSLSKIKKTVPFIDPPGPESDGSDSDAAGDLLAIFNRLQDVGELASNKTSILTTNKKIDEISVLSMSPFPSVCNDVAESPDTDMAVASPDLKDKVIDTDLTNNNGNKRNAIESITPVHSAIRKRVDRKKTPGKHFPVVDSSPSRLYVEQGSFCKQQLAPTDSPTSPESVEAIESIVRTLDKTVLGEQVCMIIEGCAEKTDLLQVTATPSAGGLPNGECSTPNISTSSQSIDHQGEVHDVKLADLSIRNNSLPIHNVPLSEIQDGEKTESNKDPSIQGTYSASDQNRRIIRDNQKKESPVDHEKEGTCDDETNQSVIDQNVECNNDYKNAPRYSRRQRIATDRFTISAHIAGGRYLSSTENGHEKNKFDSELHEMEDISMESHGSLGLSDDSSTLNEHTNAKNVQKQDHSCVHAIKGNRRSSRQKVTANFFHIDKSDEDDGQVSQASAFKSRHSRKNRTQDVIMDMENASTINRSDEASLSSESSRSESEDDMFAASVMPPKAVEKREMRKIERRLPLMQRQIVKKKSPTTNSTWTEVQVKCLQKAHRQADPQSQTFWLDISNCLEGKDHLECHSQWYSMANTPKQSKSARAGPTFAPDNSSDESEDDMFDATPMRELQNSKAALNRRLSLDLVSAIAVDRKTMVGASCGRADDDSHDFFQPKPGFKSYLENMRRDVNRARRDEAKKKSKNPGDHRKPKILSDAIYNNEIDMCAHLTPGGTLKVNNRTEDDFEDHWNDMHDAEGEEDD